MADWPDCDGTEVVGIDKHRPWGFSVHLGVQGRGKLIRI